MTLDGVLPRQIWQPVNVVSDNVSQSPTGPADWEGIKGLWIFPLSFYHYLTRYH